LDGRAEHLDGFLIEICFAAASLPSQTHDVFILATAQSTIPITVTNQATTFVLLEQTQPPKSPVIPTSIPTAPSADQPPPTDQPEVEGQ
jgi:hypothetical protein